MPNDEDYLRMARESLERAQRRQDQPRDVPDELVDRHQRRLEAQAREAAQRAAESSRRQPTVQATAVIRPQPHAPVAAHFPPQGYYGSWPPVSTRDGSIMPVELTPQFHAYYRLRHRLANDAGLTIVAWLSLVAVVVVLGGFGVSVGVGVVVLVIVGAIDILASYAVFRITRRQRFIRWIRELEAHNAFKDVADFIPASDRQFLIDSWEFHCQVMLLRGY